VLAPGGHDDEGTANGLGIAPGAADLGLCLGGILGPLGDHKVDEDQRHREGEDEEDDQEKLEGRGIGEAADGVD
jgi:Na+/glutamate symporter